MYIENRSIMLITHWVSADTAMEQNAVAAVFRLWAYEPLLSLTAFIQLLRSILELGWTGRCLVHLNKIINTACLFSVRVWWELIVIVYLFCVATTPRHGGVDDQLSQSIRAFWALNVLRQLKYRGIMHFYAGVDGGDWKITILSTKIELVWSSSRSPALSSQDGCPSLPEPHSFVHGKV